MRTKNKAITIYVTESDFIAIHNKAASCRKSLTAYLTGCGLGKQIVVLDGIEGLIGQVKRVGQQLNRLTVLANMGKIQTVYLQEAVEQLAGINEDIHKILERGR